MSSVHLTTRTLFVLLFCGLLVKAPNTYASVDDINRCIQLAADPDNPLRPEVVKGVWIERINVQQALPACRKALAAEPENNTLRYLLARTLYSQALTQGVEQDAEFEGMVNNLIAAEHWSTGMMVLDQLKDEDQAMIISKAAEQGHPWASYQQGSTLLKQKKLKEAVPWFEQAINAGVAPAHTAIFILLDSLAGGDFDSYNEGMREAALKHLRYGMRLGDPIAAEQLNRLGTAEDEYEYNTTEALILINNDSDQGAAISARINARRRYARLGDEDSIYELVNNLQTRGGLRIGVRRSIGLKKHHPTVRIR